MTDWKEYKVSTLLDSKLLSIGDGYRAKNSELSSLGFPFARAGNINGGFNFANADYFPAENISKVGEKISRVGDIVFTSKGTVGRFAFVDDSAQTFVYSPQLCYWRSLNKNFIDPKFLFYWMQGKEFYSQVDAVKGQTDMADYVSLTDQKQMKITLPPLPEQQIIAEVLSSLDDKIDLLHRQNKTLEALAEMLFRQWFVEEAQETWEPATLFDVIELVGGGTPKTDNTDYWDGSIKWISAKDITPNHRRFIVDTEKKITEQGLKTSSARVLPKYATIISARGTVGNYCLLAEDMTFSQSNYGIKPKFKDCYFFTYLLIANAVEELKSAAYGSVFDTITTSTFKEHQIKIPTKEEIQDFDETVKPYFEKMLSNEIQIRSLTKLRDTLLPKLMSGDEVRVKF